MEPRRELGKKLSVSSQIFNELEKRLSRMKKGERFATEHELCREFGVSRMTMNKVIKSLEAQNYLKRVQGSGTYVEKPVGEKAIKFLLPCPEYMVYECTYPLRLMLYGAEQEAAELGRKVEGVWVSPTNSPDDIDLSRLDDIDSQTDVIIYSFWFQKTFDFLAKRQCKAVIYTSCENNIQPEIPDDWLSLTIDPTNGMRKAVNYLASITNKNIALLHSFKQNNHPLKLVYEETLRANGKKVDPSLCCQFEWADSLERGLKRLLKDKKDKFDAILTTEPNSAGTVAKILQSENIKIPEDISLLSFGDTPWLLQQAPPISALGRPVVKMGREAVKNIANSSMNSGTMIYNMDLTVRESTEKGAGAPASPNCFPAGSGLTGFDLQ